MELGGCIPVVRMFDEAKAREFYLGYLGFAIEFEHRFGPNMPLYMAVMRGGCKIHLSEHYGDACGGATVRIAVEDLDAYHSELTAKPYKYYRPGIETMPWGLKEMQLTDPFGNRLVFFGVP